MRSNTSLSTLLLAGVILVGPTASLAQSPADADAALEACVAAARTGDETEARAAAARAEALFREQLAAHPRSAEPRIGLARVIGQCQIRLAGLMAAGRLIRESNRLLEEAIELDPRNWTAHFTLGMNHFYTPKFLGRTDDSIRAFETALALQGERTEGAYLAMTYLHLGDLYLRTDRGNDAVAVWRRGLQLFPRHEALRARVELHSGRAEG